MGRLMTLVEAVERLGEFDINDTIYAAVPWTEHSEVVVAPEPKPGSLPTEAAERGLKYFIEVNIAIDFLEDWIRSLKRKPATLEMCQRLIQYATSDA